MANATTDNATNPNTSDSVRGNSGKASTDLTYLFEGDPGQVSLLQGVFYSISVVQMILTCGGNALTIATVCRTPSLRTISNMYVVSLALADFLMGMSFPYINIAFLPCFHNWLQGSKFACLFALFLCWFLGAACVNSMMFVALDRYLYIVRPFLYDVYITPLRTKMTIGMSWLLPLCIACIILVRNNWTPNTPCSILTMLDKAVAADLTMIVFCVMSAVILSCYLSILRVAIRQRMSVTPSGVTASQWQLVKMMATAFGVYIVCWLPTLLVIEMSFFDASTAWLLYVTYPITCLNSGLNFFIFAFLNSEFHRAFKKMLSIGTHSVSDNLSNSCTRNLAREQNESVLGHRQ